MLVGARAIAHHRRRFHTSTTKLDAFLTTAKEKKALYPHTHSSNSLLTYIIAQAVKNILPARIQDDYEVTFSSSAASYLSDSPTMNSGAMSHVLGEGRFGVVRTCTELATGEVRAVKTQRKKYARRDPTTGDFFEVEAMHALPKPGFQLLKVYETSLKVHLVTELLRGPMLFDFWSKQYDWEMVPAKDEARVAAHIRSVTEAIQVCNGAGFQHLDVKFENLMFRDEAATDLVLIDFGSARRVDADRRLRDLLGSPSYASPEVKCMGRFSPTSDAYSLGVMAHAMLMGTFPDEDEAEDGETVLYFDEFEWSNFSPHALDFTQRLLDPDDKTRLSVGDALEHPFLKN